MSNFSVIQLQIDETQMVGTLKSLILSTLNIPVCRQELGWKLDRPPLDTTVLSSLNLPTHNTLRLTVIGDYTKDYSSEEYATIKSFRGLQCICLLILR